MVKMRPFQQNEDLMKTKCGIYKFKMRTSKLKCAVNEFKQSLPDTLPPAPLKLSHSKEPSPVPFSVLCLVLRTFFFWFFSGGKALLPVYFLVYFWKWKNCQTVLVLEYISRFFLLYHIFFLSNFYEFSKNLKSVPRSLSQSILQSFQGVRTLHLVYFTVYFRRKKP